MKKMKTFGFLLVLAAFLYSCNDSNTDKQAPGGDTTQNAGTSVPETKGTRTLTDAVKELKSILESRDKTAISGLLDFPVPDSVMRLYLDDSVFQTSYRKNGDKISQSMFNYYFDTIARYTYLDKVTNIFKYVNADSLQYVKELEKEFKDKNQQCTEKYSIRVDGDEVTLVYGTNFNDEYLKPKGAPKSDEEAPCEFSAFWVFRFDGNKLKLIRQDIAG